MHYSQPLTLDSNTMTSMPNDCNWRAAARPEIPAPMMMTRPCFFAAKQDTYQWYICELTGPWQKCVILWIHFLINKDFSLYYQSVIQMNFWLSHSLSYGSGHGGSAVSLHQLIAGPGKKTVVPPWLGPYHQWFKLWLGDDYRHQAISWASDDLRMSVMPSMANCVGLYWPIWCWNQGSIST